MTSKINKEFLVQNGFALKEYLDGLFWLKYKNDDYFIQVDEKLENASIFKGLG